MSILTKRLGNGIWGSVDGNDSDNPIVIDNNDYAKRYDYNSDGTILYQGWAVPGSLTSSAVWKIKKYTWTTVNSSSKPDTETWAGGTNAKSNVWDNRASLTYV